MMHTPTKSTYKKKRKTTRKLTKIRYFLCTQKKKATRFYAELPSFVNISLQKHDFILRDFI